MKNGILILLAGSIFFMSCSSTTLIQSNPSGAKLYLNGEPVGTTPYSHTDTKIIGTQTTVQLQLEGYQPLHTYFSRDEEVDIGAVVGGVFVLIPFLWTMKYKAAHYYELTPLTEGYSIAPTPPTKKASHSSDKSKTDRLRELKQLLDEGIITQEEFEKEKKKILDEE